MAQNIKEFQELIAWEIRTSLQNKQIIFPNEGRQKLYETTSFESLYYNPSFFQDNLAHISRNPFKGKRSSD